MRYREFYINESSGVTNRQPGELYVHTTDPDNHLVLQRVYLLPPNKIAYETAEDMINAVKENIPPGEKLIEENKPTNGTKAAILVHWTDHQGNDEWRVQYTRDFSRGPHGKYMRPAGYVYAKSAQQESVPIKPSDLIDASFRPVTELGDKIKQNLGVKLSGTSYEDLTGIISQAIDFAKNGTVSPIDNGAKYANVIAKYAGEYLGVIGIVQGGIRKGDFDKAIKQLDIQSLAGAQVSFPDDKAGELIDSILRLPGGVDIGISTKMKQGGGKASSLSGVYKLMTDEIRNESLEAAELLEALATAPARPRYPHQVDQVGIIIVAVKLGILDKLDIDVFKGLPWESKNINDLKKSPNLFNLTSTQGLQPKSQNSPSYRVFYHALGAVANKVIGVLNGPQHKEFRNLIKKCLANNNYIQFLTDVRKSGDNITIDYTSKFPAVFDGEPKLENAAYWATGQQGRLGFKLK
jgi:hypothetical protein